MPKETLTDDPYTQRLTEIGRITTTWAKFEHWIDQAIWILADVEGRKGVCITSQMGSTHAKFRALIALMVEAGRPPEAIKEASKLSEHAAAVSTVRNQFAHSPLDMGINFETREFEVYRRRTGVQGKKVTFETSPLTVDELREAFDKVAKLYMRLIDNWALIVGVSSADTLAPPHQ